tara:strand:+ start:19 stop:1047 length:1029 start_codon:yes stop_codon:yes gene_type:complete
MAEESKIIEEVVESTEETKEQSFDPTAFVEGEAAEKVESLTNEAKPEEVKAEGNTESESETESEGDFSWDSVEVDSKVGEETNDPKAEEKTEEDNDWDDEETVAEDKQEPVAAEFDWEGLSKETGIEASSKEEFIAQVKDAMKPDVEPNDTIKTLGTYLELSDKDLVIADMRAAKYDDADIEDTIERLETAGLLKREATLVRQQLNKHIHSEKDRIREEKAQAEKSKTENANKSRKELQNFIKGKEEFFGGKVSQKDKKQLYNYITKGDFAQDIFESHANVAEAAFLWRNKEKIFKMIKTQGVEQGKSKVLDGITSPSRGNRSSNNFEAPSKGFDPNKFMAG